MTQVSALSRPFVEGLAVGVLRYQRCPACGRTQRLARYACQACGERGLVWCDGGFLGTVFALSTVNRAPTEPFRALVPYTLVLVDMAEGSRLMGHAAPGLKIGDEVRAETFIFEGHHLLRFHPSGA